MAKRKKRLEKQIEGIQKQIDLHHVKVEEYGHEKPWLPDYREGQIEDLEIRKKDREKKLKKLRR